MKRIVAITGGIGAGKSVVCRIVRALGYPVYDCDTEARLLMDADAGMRQRIADEVCVSALRADGSIDRPTLAAAVFADSKALERLNAIVHGAVRNHFAEWASRMQAPVIFVETAILYESGFDSLVNEIWEVTAPTRVRIDRVMKRNGLSREAIERRMAAQSACTRPSHRIIVNDGEKALIPQIMQLLDNER